MAQHARVGTVPSLRDTLTYSYQPIARREKVRGAGGITTSKPPQPGHPATVWR
jgi:hypothetical protein